LARIAGVDLPRDKKISISLTYIFGIGRTTAMKVAEEAGVDPNKRTRDLDEAEVVKIREVIDKTLVVEGDLRRERTMAVKRLMDIGCYRGLRHRKSMPVRGQRTKTNARTRKGPKRTVAGKKKVGK
jgi:small subunit ribosomal protein S13